MGVKEKAFKAALPHTLPIAAGFSFLGLAYGIYMNSMGFSFLWPMFMSMTIFAGSMEFVSVTLLCSAFQPWYAFLLALMVNARHLFYGVSMLSKYHGTGWKKFFLIYGMCDESFSINVSVKPPDNVDKGWFMLFVTLLNYAYWVLGATLGGIFGSFLPMDTTGIEFVMTALFTVILLDQWKQQRQHTPAIIGVLASLVCLVIFGKDTFILPAMASILVLLIMQKKHLYKEEGQ